MRRFMGIIVIIVAACFVTLIGCTPSQQDAWKKVAEDFDENVQTFNIAFIGDSYAAGEGNPAGPGMDPWVDRQCHRSENNGRINAVAALDTRPTTINIVIEFIDVSCSGATIDTGLLGGGHRGVPRRGHTNPPLEPQIDQVRHWMTIMGIDSLDAIVISVGGNDIGFPRIVANCLSPAMFGLPPRCSENTELRQEINVGIPDESTILGFDNLLDGYHRLDSHIRETLNPHHILIVGYPNPTRDENGQYCHHFGDGFPILHEHWSITEGFFGEPLPSFLVGGRISNITAADNEWIETDIINRLNGIIEDAAQEFDWIFVGGMDRLTRRKGYCSNDPWFNTPSSSWGVQSDLYGTAHFNRYGYDAYQQVIQKAIVENLEMRVAPLPMVRPESFGWWIGQNGIQERGIWPVTTTHWQGRGITNHTLIVGAMVFPTARVIEQVELEASLNQPRLSAFDDGVEIRQVTAASGNLAGTEHLYRTELPFSPISMCDWVHYRWRVTYSGPGLEATLTSEVMQVHATAHSNGYGAVCPPMSN